MLWKPRVLSRLSLREESMNQDIYVMRIWYASSDKQSWRITVTDTQSQQKYSFAHLEKMIDFFRERLEQDSKTSEAHNFP
jgi:hypothetical protein